MSYVEVQIFKYLKESRAVAKENAIRILHFSCEPPIKDEECKNCGKDWDYEKAMFCDCDDSRTPMRRISPCTDGPRTDGPEIRFSHLRVYVFRALFTAPRTARFCLSALLVCSFCLLCLLCQPCEALLGFVRCHFSSCHAF